jgi:hypothetical protein
MIPMINFFKRPVATILLGLAAGITCLMSPAIALADHAVLTPNAPGHSDGVAYLLVLFCVALAVIILVRSSNRTAEVRLHELDEQ